MEPYLQEGCEVKPETVTILLHSVVDLGDHGKETCRVIDVPAETPLASLLDLLDERDDFIEIHRKERWP